MMANCFQELVEFVDFGDLETAEETKVRQILYGPRPQRDKKKVEFPWDGEVIGVQVSQTDTHTSTQGDPTGNQTVDSHTQNAPVYPNIQEQQKQQISNYGCQGQQSMPASGYPVVKPDNYRTPPPGYHGEPSHYVPMGNMPYQVMTTSAMTYGDMTPAASGMTFGDVTQAPYGNITPVTSGMTFGDVSMQGMATTLPNEMYPGPQEMRTAPGPTTTKPSERRNKKKRPPGYYERMQQDTEFNTQGSLQYGGSHDMQQGGVNNWDNQQFMESHDSGVNNWADSMPDELQYEQGYFDQEPQSEHYNTQSSQNSYGQQGYNQNNYTQQGYGQNSNSHQDYRQSSNLQQQGYNQHRNYERQQDTSQNARYRAPANQSNVQQHYSDTNNPNRYQGHTNTNRYPDHTNSNKYLDHTNSNRYQEPQSQQSYQPQQNMYDSPHTTHSYVVPPPAQTGSSVHQQGGYQPPGAIYNSQMKTESVSNNHPMNTQSETRFNQPPVDTRSHMNQLPVESRSNQSVSQHASTESVSKSKTATVNISTPQQISNSPHQEPVNNVPFTSVPVKQQTSETNYQVQPKVIPPVQEVHSSQLQTASNRTHVPPPVVQGQILHTTGQQQNFIHSQPLPANEKPPQKSPWQQPVDPSSCLVEGVTQSMDNVRLTQQTNSNPQTISPSSVALTETQPSSISIVKHKQTNSSIVSMKQPSVNNTVSLATKQQSKSAGMESDTPTVIPQSAKQEPISAVIQSEAIKNQNEAPLDCENEAFPSVQHESVSNSQSDVSQTISQSDTAPSESEAAKAAPSPWGAKPVSWAGLFKNTTKTPSSSAVPEVQIEASPTKILDLSSKVDKQLDDSQNVGVSEDPRAHTLADHIVCGTISHVSQGLQPRGLINRGNWCYINATLQALVACPPFYNLLKGIPDFSKNRGPSSTPVLDSIVQFAHEFSPFVRNTEKGGAMKGRRSFQDIIPGKEFEPTYVYQMLQNMQANNRFQLGRQEDAEEFLSSILDGIHEEMTSLITLVKGEQPAANGNIQEEEGDELEEQEESWEQVGPKKKSVLTRRNEFAKTPIADIFSGYIRSAVYKSTAKDTATLQPYFTLQLDIQSENVWSVREALEGLVSKEQISGYTCSTTKTQVEISKKVTFEELPPVLILHLKYFVYDKDGGCQKLVKRINYSVELEISKDHISPNARSKIQNNHRMYKLFAVVFHHGKLATGGGHYTTGIYHPAINGWIHIDDSSVKPVPLQFMMHHSPPRVPYLLYYRRVDRPEH